MPAFFYTNLLEYYVLRMENGTLLLPIYLPEDFAAPFVDPLTAAGPAVLELFLHPELYRGKTTPVVGDVISPREDGSYLSRYHGHSGKICEYLHTCRPPRLFPGIRKGRAVGAGTSEDGRLRRRIRLFPTGMRSVLVSPSASGRADMSRFSP